MLLVYLTFDMQITCQKSYCNSDYDFNAKIHFLAKTNLKIDIKMKLCNKPTLFFFLIVCIEIH